MPTGYEVDALRAIVEISRSLREISATLLEIRNVMMANEPQVAPPPAGPRPGRQGQ